MQKGDPKFAPGTTAKLSPTREPAVPPQRPRTPSKTDEIDTQTGAPIERKGVTPRAPSVVSPREVTMPSLDIREIVLNAVKEATAPLETRIKQLELRLALLDADFREAVSSSPEETRPNAAMPVPPGQAFVPAFVPAPPPMINAPAFAPASPFSNLPVSASAFAPVPAAAPVAPMRPAFASMPQQQMNFEDAHLSPDEVAMFDGNKRGRRMTIYFVLVLLLLGGLLGLWANISRG